MNTRYKFLRLVDGKKKSNSGSLTWRKGKWEKVSKDLELCERGLHCSVRMLDAFSYVSGELVARVEVRGESVISDDKEAWEEMRLVDIRRWSKKDSVALSIFAAEKVLANYEKQGQQQSQQQGQQCQQQSQQHGQQGQQHGQQQLMILTLGWKLGLRSYQKYDI